MNADFQRIKRLPPYVFNIVNDLKAKARARGEDIIDFGMGNPDQPTPKHIVEKLVETARRDDTHRYSVSRGIPRLRRAICNWYRTRYAVELDLEPGRVGMAHMNRSTDTTEMAGHARPTWLNCPESTLSQFY